MMNPFTFMQIVYKLLGMNTKLFFESIGKLGLSDAQMEALTGLCKACFEGFEQHLTLPMAENHNIHDSIQAPMATNGSHSNDMGAYKNPMTLSTNPNANRDPKEEMKELFPGKIQWKRGKIKSDPKIREMMEKAQSHLPNDFPVQFAVNTSAQPMVTGFAAPNRMNYSPYKQGCAVGCYDGGGGGGADVGGGAAV